MCVSLAPAVLRGTTILLAEAHHPRHTGALVHLLGYQNTAVNRAKGPNAMLLHFPAAQPMTPENILDTRNGKHVLHDMVEAVRPRTRGRSLSFGALQAKNVVVFDFDIYTIALAKSACYIPDTLPQIPVNKRPEIDRELLEAYSDWFVTWPVALCCFDNRDVREAAPMLWWYPPKNPDIYQVPGLDSHTGGVPDLQERVDVDHWLLFGSPRLRDGMPVKYRDQGMDATLRAMLPDKVTGAHFGGRMSNGDFQGSTGHMLESADMSSIRRVIPAPVAV